MRISGWSSYVCSSDLGIVISPGPCDPDRAGICVELVERLAPKVPMLGVCLGHQAIGQVFGGVVRRGPVPMHGKVSTVHTDGKGLFEGLPGSFAIHRYPSSGQRRVGKEGVSTFRTGWTPYNKKKKNQQSDQLTRIKHTH